VDAVCTTADFEIVEIVDDTNPYLDLLGIEWDINNQAIINLKIRQMVFYGGDIRVIAPLDHIQGRTYVKHIKEDYENKELENIYKMTSRMEDYINPTTNVMLI